MEKYQLLRTPIQSIKVDDSACDVNDLARCGGIQVTVPGTDSWADLVRRAVDSEWTGIEALGGFDGTVAEAVRANHSAYGQSVADTLMSVRTWDLEADAQRTFPAVEAAAVSDGRFEILDVNFLFVQGDLTRPVVDDDLAALLDVQVGARVPLRQVADATAPHIGAFVNLE